MYKEIGALDAKARLSELLREVRDGHCYTITVRGEPVAELVPVGSGAGGSAVAALEAMRQLPKISGVTSQQLRDWMTEGRK